MSCNMINYLESENLPNILQGPKESHRSITEFEGNSAALCNDLFQHALVQRDVTGREHVVVHALCLEEMQEYDTTSCSWKSLTFEESREFIETLLVCKIRLV